MSKRIKIKLATIGTRAEAELVMCELAAAVNAHRKTCADRDALVLEIQKRFTPGVAQLEGMIAQKTDALRAWAEANPGEFVNGRKSIEMAAGTLGFRTGTPKLALLGRAWNWEKVLATLKRCAPRFVRTKSEVDREAILQEHAALRFPMDPTLRVWGLKVVQEESFFVDPKLSEAERRQVVTDGNGRAVAVVEFAK